MGVVTLENQNKMMRVAKLFIVVAMGATTQENKKQR
jgi:hypothetical protein